MAIRIKIAAEYDQRGLKKAQKELSDFGDKAKKALAAVGVATAAVGIGLVKFGSDSISAAQNVQQANNRLEQVAKSMNLFGSQTAEVTRRLIDFSEQNEVLVGVDGEVIKATQAKLLTFKQLAQTADNVGGSFDRATMAALDLAAAGFGSAETNATQLGKALQDPIKGITALTKSGVTFTQQEREKIKALVESGNILEAQNLILAAIETQVGGTAQATAKASDRMKLAFENILESVGLQLLPAFEDFSEEILKITPELEQGLASAAKEVAQILASEVLPAIQNFTNWLASPAGTKTIKDLTSALVGLIKGFVDVTGFIIQNREVIANLVIVIGGFTVAVKAATIATTLHAAVLQILAAKSAGATVATTGLTTALKLLPWAALAIGVASFVQSLADYSNEIYGSKVNTEGLNKAQADQARKVEGLQRLLKQYQYAIDNGTEANKKLAREGIARVTQQLAAMGVRTDVAGQHLRALNNISLNKLHKEVFNASTHLKELGILAGQVDLINITKVDTSSTGESSAAKAKREREEAFKKVQSLIKAAQKELLSAQAEYDKSVQKLQLDNTKAVERINLDFGKKLADIAQQSRERLTNAFRTAGSFTLSDLFKVEDSGSVDNLITNLRNKLQASRNLIANAGALNAAGFTQTFIEQIVSAGTTTGNELAQAILQSNPETQAELKKLFADMESTTNTGMDTLAQEIYQKQGLATRELKDLYATTQMELADALLEQQIKLEESLREVNKTFLDSVKAVKDKLKEDLDEMDGFFGGLGSTIDAFIKRLDDLIAKQKLAFGNDKPLSGLPSETTPPPVIGYLPRAVMTTFQQPATQNITINATTDVTQSPAQVGRTIATLINRYTSSGGSVQVGPVF